MIDFRSGCLIPNYIIDSFTITGGAYGGNPISRVISYNEGGWLKNLPDLAVKRFKHGCTSFVSGVSIFLMNEKYTYFRLLHN